MSLGKNVLYSVYLTLRNPEQARIPLHEEPFALPPQLFWQRLSRGSPIPISRAYTCSSPDCPCTSSLQERAQEQSGFCPSEHARRFHPGFWVSNALCGQHHDGATRAAARVPARRGRDVGLRLGGHPFGKRADRDQPPRGRGQPGYPGHPLRQTRVQRPAAWHRPFHRLGPAPDRSTGPATHHVWQLRLAASRRVGARRRQPLQPRIYRDRRYRQRQGAEH